jgi:hypothetical protein
MDGIQNCDSCINFSIYLSIFGYCCSWAWKKKTCYFSIPNRNELESLDLWTLSLESFRFKEEIVLETWIVGFCRLCFAVLTYNTSASRVVKLAQSNQVFVLLRHALKGCWWFVSDKPRGYIVYELRLCAYVKPHVIEASAAGCIRYM